MAFIEATGEAPEFGSKEFEIMAREPADAALIASQAELIAKEMAELRKLYPRSAARQLFRTLPWTEENRRRIALAFLAEGDLPARVVYSFCRVLGADEGEAVAIEMDELRQRHFAALGKPVPPDVGPPLR